MCSRNTYIIFYDEIYVLNIYWENTKQGNKKKYKTSDIFTFKTGLFILKIYAINIQY